MTVYVLIIGLYDPEVCGVYSSLDAAKNAARGASGFPIGDWREENGAWWGTPLGEVCVQTCTLDTAITP